MLVPNGSLPADMALLLVMALLWVMLLVRLVLVLLGHVHLHIPLVPNPTIHHHVLALLVRLVEHAIRIVVGCLRDWRAGWRRCVVVIASSHVIDRRSIPRKMAMVMILLVMLRVIILASSGLLKPVRTICHRMNRADLDQRKRQPSPLERLCLMRSLVVLRM